MPPVSFDGVTVQTASAQFIGGSLAQSSDTVHLIACTPIADATSTDARLARTCRPSAIVKISVERPRRRSTRASGRRSPRSRSTWSASTGPRRSSSPNLHARKATCAGAPPPRLSAGTEDPALGAGAIAGPGPAGRTGASTARHRSSRPPTRGSPGSRAASSRRSRSRSPTASGRSRSEPCSPTSGRTEPGRASSPRPPRRRASRITSVPTTGQPTDYLRFPTTANVNASALTENPAAQFRAFETGQHTVTGSLQSLARRPRDPRPLAHAPSCTSTTPVRCISAASAVSCRRGRRSMRCRTR